MKAIVFALRLLLPGLAFIGLGISMYDPKESGMAWRMIVGGAILALLGGLMLYGQLSSSSEVEEIPAQTSAEGDSESESVRGR